MQGSPAPLAIGLVHWALPPTVGGVESHLADYTRLLADEGARVTVFTGAGEEPGDLDPRVDVANHPMLALRRRLRRDPARWRMAGLADWFSHELTRRGIDVVHGHNLHYFSAGPARALNRVRESGRVPGLKLFHTIHNVFHDGRRQAQQVAGWDGLYAVSDFLVEECGQHLGLTVERTYLGVDSSRFATNSRILTGDQPVILQPTRLLPWKGADCSVRMLAELRRRGIEAQLILMDTEQIIDWDHEVAGFRRYLEDLIDERGVRDLVRFEAATAEQMPKVFERADVVVYPSTKVEPLGLAALEGMAAGRPIVVSNLGGIPETVVKRKTGYVVPAGDWIKLANQVAQLVKNPERCRRMGETARQRVQSHFDISTYLQSMLARYHEPTPSPAVDAVATEPVPAPPVRELAISGVSE
jgi:glycosyltransferase involved in cell wall biosynthesis